MILAEFVHGSVDHAKLRGIAVCDDNLIAVLYKIRDGLCRLLDRNLLLRQSRSQCPVSQCYNHFLFHTHYLYFSMMFRVCDTEII